jgi:hypothetical protein
MSSSTDDTSGVTEIFDAPPIRDARQMVGPRTHTTAEEIEAGWREWAQENGIIMRRRADPTDVSIELRESDETLVPYVSANAWRAACPACGDSAACAPFFERGCCLGCGTIYRISWPVGPDEVLAAAALLAKRPAPMRWWRPDRGETVETLEAENEAFGYNAEPVRKALVAIDDLERTLGPKAVKKLQDAGVIG